MSYSQHFSTRATPQTEQADARQVQNSSGGFTFQLTPQKQLERWLILGCEGGTYYASEQKLTRENAKTIIACLDQNGPDTVRTIATMSASGRAPKNDPAIFALAIAAGHSDPATRAAALEAIPLVCRTGTHLFQFVEAVKGFRGWGRGLKRAISNWYAEKTPEDLAYQVAKYQQRNGWSHRDLMRLAHPEPKHEAIYRWVVSGADKLGERTVTGKGARASRQYGAVGELPEFLAAFEELKHADERRTCELIRKHRFTHEMVNTQHLKSPTVWEALLQHMPMTAMIRSLARMTAIGFIKPMASCIPTIAERLTDSTRLRKARVHPIQMLSALLTYTKGQGERGKLSWSPVPQIIDALDAGFYEAFGALEPSGARMLLAIDVSASMDGGEIAGIPGLSPRIGAAVMAMVTARVEKQWHCVGFAQAASGHPGGNWGGGSPKMVDIVITPRMRLDDVARVMRNIPMGGTDCALPMLYAAGSGIDVDCFAIYTDNETWAGNVHPHQALRAYRDKSGRAAKLTVTAFSATPFTIADPSDPGMMDLVGFDSAAPQVLADFSKVG